MAEYVKSVWKITWDAAGTPWVMLTYGDETEAEIALPWRQEVRTPAVYGTGAAPFFPLGRVSRVFSFSVVEKKTATVHELRNAVLAGDAALTALAGVTKGLKIEVSGGAVYTTTAAAIEGHEATIDRAGGGRLVHRYQVRIGLLAVT